MLLQKIYCMFLCIILLFSNYTKYTTYSLNLEELEIISSIEGQWEIIEYKGYYRQEHLIPEPENYYSSLEEVQEHNKRYLQTNFIISLDTISELNQPSEWGYYYSYEEIFHLLRIPEGVYAESPILYVTLNHIDFEDSIDIILGNDKKAFINIDSYFYEIMKVDKLNK